MKGLLLVAALLGGADPGSLGIGMDVLPEAFSFAASRVGYAPHLMLAGCDSRSCRWTLGAGLEMTASLAPGTLTLDRLEAELDAPAASAPGSRFADACLAIVALLAPEASPGEQRSIARSIAMPSGTTRQTRLNMPEGDTSFYGSGRATTTGGIVARCGAVAASSDTGSKL